MQYLLDTNICIYLLNGRSERLIEKIVSFDVSDIAVSIVSVAELMYGVSKSTKVEENRLTLMKFLSPFQLLEFDLQDAIVYGNIENQLRRRGKPIDPFDTLIAAQALTRKLTIITNDKHFSQVTSLDVENWM
jgi:tRNA(fMet)-specific endonuclease VapC